MKRLILRVWHEDDGVLSFEWVLLITVVVIGIVVGVTASRDAIVDEIGDVSEAAVALDQSYAIPLPLMPYIASDGINTSASNPNFQPLTIIGLGPIGGGGQSGFIDFGVAYDCTHGINGPQGQEAELDLE